MVLGIVALITSIIPFINNFSFLLAVIGIVFALVGLVAASRERRRGKALAIAGLVTCVVSVVVVIASQSMYGAIIDEATSGPSVVGSSSGSTQNATPQNPSQSDQNAPQSGSAKADYSNMAVGESAELSNGLTVAVLAVQSGLANYDGSPITAITVSYSNNGKSDVSFNTYDWKAQDAQGAQRSPTYFYEGRETVLNSGSLAPGGMVTGSLYFDGDIAKALYYSNIFYDNSAAAWVLS